MLRKKKSPKDRALASFDDFYGSVFGPKWKSIRLGLLCDNKYIAMVNNFGDTQETIKRLTDEGAMNIKDIVEVTKRRLTELKQASDKDGAQPVGSQSVGAKIENIMQAKRSEEASKIFPEEFQFDKSEHDPETANRIVDSAYGTAALYEFIPATKLKGMEDWVFESDHYKYYKAEDSEFPIEIETENEITIPEHLHLYTYEMGNISTFPRARRSITGVSTHFHMDGASILPALFLDIQPGNRVLDACAAPGGKSMLMLQTMYPNILVANDLSQSRVKRIKNLFGEFLIDFERDWLNKRCFVTESDARALDDYDQYDKVLVDVPCTTDRHSIHDDDNNLFKPSRVKERLKLPEIQADILANCIRMARPGGGHIMYSTCSLSPVQNDGVVHMALSKCFNEHGITARVKDLSLAIRPFTEIFRFHNPKLLKYGQLVLPYLPANFGPMYFCKIERIK